MKSMKKKDFASTMARYVSIKTCSEAGNRGPWTSAAEFGVFIATNGTSKGYWGLVIPMPLVPVAAFIIQDTGDILTYASFEANMFPESGNTITAIYNSTT